MLKNLQLQVSFFLSKVESVPLLSNVTLQLKIIKKKEGNILNQ